MLYKQNKLPFQEIVKGRYGRKTAYTNVPEITAANVVSVVSKALGIFYNNRAEAEYLWRYKNGDQPILYRTKTIRDDIINTIVENHAYEFVQFGVTQTYGEPIQYIRRKHADNDADSERLDKAVDRLNDIMHNCFKAARNIRQGEWKIATGTSYLAIGRTGNQKNPIMITVPTPLNTFVIYSESTEEPMLAVQQLKDLDNEQYLMCFSTNHTYKIKGGKLIESKLHVFGGIPIVEVPNNQDRLSDIEIVIGLLDAMNNMQSNRMDSIEQFVQSWVKFVNCDIDAELFAKMKMLGALTVKSNNGSDNKADVDIITQELNQSESQIAKEDLLNNALSILAIPNKQGNSGGDTQGAVELRNGWDFSKGRAKLKDAYVIEAEKRFAEIALSTLRVEGENLGISTSDFDVQISHSPTDNLIVKAQALDYLLKAGVSPLIALRQCGLFNDAEKVYLDSKPYLDMLYPKASENGLDAYQEKQVEAFVKWLNSGLSPEKAAEKVGLEVSDIQESPAMAKWNYDAE